MDFTCPANSSYSHIFIPLVHFLPISRLLFFDSLRSTCELVTESHFSHLTSSQRRLEFIPIDWRTSLHLPDELIASSTPSSLGPLRALFNNTIIDVFYYTSPVYRHQVTQNLAEELTRIYTIFCSRNPYFETSGGQVSIIAHSLGSVIIYDVLTQRQQTEPHKREPISV
ncbi:unnamed protein product [Protopolystoma xenopodis]|uniref:DDHD domain-containing protein n=1 Tax=Protopolystoma xenopodis TaxID=117903 RepID=A0A3S5A5D5_9PLAT|nr:unnamed protein product [Protopolystoma xenopodis]